MWSGKIDKNHRQIHLKGLALALVAFLLVIMATPPLANAQIQLQIGGNEAEFKARLAQAGFDRIDTVDLSLSKSKFNACKGDKRYRIEFKWTGQVKQKVIGKCRIAINQNDIRKILQAKGYRRIDIEDRAGKYLAVGCQGNDRYRVELNHFGDISRERRIGSCQQELSPADITAQLKQDGFNRIRFTDRQLPKYIAEACRNRDRIELIMNRLGEIRSSKRIGNCSTQIDPNRIAEILRDKGYSRVQVIDARLPRYLAEACKKGRRFEVTLNRWGEVSNEVRIGRCRQSYSPEQIEASMRDNGYKNVSIVESGRNFVTRGCRQNRYEEIVLSKFGELVSQKDLGSCNAPRINDLAETLRGRGLSRLKFFVEACKGNRKVRISFDEFANRTGREVIGNC